MVSTVYNSRNLFKITSEQNEYILFQFNDDCVSYNPKIVIHSILCKAMEQVRKGGKGRQDKEKKNQQQEEFLNLG